MENKKCKGELEIHETSDGIDIYVCKKCGNIQKFDFDMECKKDKKINNTK